jgi:hypothetical protein
LFYDKEESKSKAAKRCVVAQSIGMSKPSSWKGLTGRVTGEIKLSTTLEKKAPVAVISASFQAKALNAESVTSIVTSFLKRIGNKGALKPKRVTLEEMMYVVEIEMKKFTAVVRVDSETHEIKGYEIQPKGEESSSFTISPKAVAIIFGISAAVHVAMYFVLKIVGL